MLSLVCVRGTQHDSILLHLGVRTVGGSQSSTGKISSPTGQTWERPYRKGLSVCPATQISSLQTRTPEGQKTTVLNRTVWNQKYKENEMNGSNMEQIRRVHNTEGTA